MLSPPTRWVLLRGLGREARHWHDFPALFSRALGNVDVCCLDLPGVGSESGRPSPTSVRKIALDVLERWPIAAADASWGVLGISLGGMVALELHELAPESLSSTIVVNASSGLNRSGQRLKWSAARALIDIALTRDPLRRERKIGELTLNSVKSDDPIYRERAALAESAPLGFPVFFNQMLAASRFEPPALEASALLFLCSAKDRMVDPDCSEALASYYAAPLRIHPWAGHDLPIDDADWICEQARRWARV